MGVYAHKGGWRCVYRNSHVGWFKKREDAEWADLHAKQLSPITRAEQHQYLVDDDVRVELDKFSWFPNHNGYLRRYDNKSSANVMLHLQAWEMCGGSELAPGQQVDHINHNKRDNRSCNLRKVTRRGNQLNRSRASGVSRMPCGSWRVKVGTGARRFQRNYEDEDTARLVAKNVRGKFVEQEVIEYLQDRSM
jgi:hypothetical protein